MSSSDNGKRAMQPRQDPAVGAGNDDGTDALAQFERSFGAKRIERMAETQIVERLRLVEFNPTSDLWRRFSGALIEYGYAVFVAWGVTGTLYLHAAQHGRGRGVRGLTKIPETLKLNHDEATALAGDLLTVSIEAFRTRSLPTWSPTGRASLKTYFIGRCLMELPGVYVVWNSRERKRVPIDRFISVDDGRHGDWPSDQAERRVLLDALFNGDDLVRAMFELQQDGYSLQEIAEILSTPDHPLTEAAVRTRMHRLRGRARERGPTDG